MQDVTAEELAACAERLAAENPGISYHRFINKLYLEVYGHPYCDHPECIAVEDAVHLNA